MYNFRIGHFNDEVLEWKKLLAIACTALEKVMLRRINVEISLQNISVFLIALHVCVYVYS